MGDSWPRSWPFADRQAISQGNKEASIHWAPPMRLRAIYTETIGGPTFRILSRRSLFLLFGFSEIHEFIAAETRNENCSITRAQFNGTSRSTAKRLIPPRYRAMCHYMQPYNRAPTSLHHFTNEPPKPDALSPAHALHPADVQTSPASPVKTSERRYQAQQ